MPPELTSMASTTLGTHPKMSKGNIPYVTGIELSGSRISFLACWGAGACKVRCPLPETLTRNPYDPTQLANRPPRLQHLLWL